jgi:predicted transcriptional regulator
VYALGVESLQHKRTQDASKTVSVRLTPEILAKLDTMAEAIQHAADELEQGQADLMSHDEVKQWLASWGTDYETAPPACE